MQEEAKQSSIFTSVNLMRDIFPNVIQKTATRANNCRVYKIKYKHRSRTRVILMVRGYEDYSNPKGHLVSLALDIPKEQREQVLKSKRTAILTIPMKTYCTCPAYTFWGSKYIATKKGYNINSKGREDRPPNVRDPKRKNIVCKHIAAVTLALKSQSVYKAMVGSGKQSLSVLAENNPIIDLLSDIPEISVEECQIILEEQGYKLSDNFTQDNFEELATNFMQGVLNG